MTANFNLNVRHQEKAVYTEMPPKSFLIYGEPKVGKTTLAASFPKPLIINVLAENGTTEIAGDVFDIESVDSFAAVVNALKNTKHNYQTVVLDGLSTLVLGLRAEKDVKDVRRAVGMVTEELSGVLHDFLSLITMSRVLVAHAKKETDSLTIERPGRNGKPYKEYITKVSVYPDLPPRLRGLVAGRVDAMCYAYGGGANGHSKAWWLPLDTETRYIQAGNRLGLPTTTDLNFDDIKNAIINPA